MTEIERPTGDFAPKGNSREESLRLERVLDGLTGILDDAPFGIALLDPPEILYMSFKCRNLLEALQPQKGGKPVNQADIRRIDSTCFPKKILDAISKHNLQDTTHFTVRDLKNENQMFVELRPLRLRSSPLKARMGLTLVIKNSDQQVSINEQLLQTAYDLTTSEARICSLLANGANVSIISRALRIHPSTARTHIKRVYKKTRSTRQAELMRLLINSAKFE